MKVLVTHPGTQHSFALAEQLERFGCLGRFWTGIAYNPQTALGRGVELLSGGVRGKLATRRILGLPSDKLRIQPRLELRALGRLRAGHDSQATMFERNAAFQATIPENELAASDAIIGVDTASWDLAQRSASLGRPFLLDRTTGYYPALANIDCLLRAQFPDWLEAETPRHPQLASAEKAEHDLATRIAVGSSFTRRTLLEAGVPAEKIVITGLGVDLSMFRPADRERKERPLRFLFVGAVGARKGVPLLLDAWRSLRREDSEIWLAGSITAQVAKMIPDVPGLRALGKISRGQLPRIMQQCDVMVLPSYCEGFGAVMLEGLACGLPLIATDATAAPDLITNNVEGFVVPAGDKMALQDTMQRFIDSRGHREQMSIAARRCAEYHSWDAYGSRWMDILASLSTIGERGASKHPQVGALVVHPGTQYSFSLAKQLSLHGCLSRFWTGFAYAPKSFVGRSLKLLPAPMQARLANRELDGVPSAKYRLRPDIEFRAVSRLRVGEQEQSVMLARNAEFQQQVPDRDISASDVVIGFDTSSWLLAERAHNLSRPFILDRSIGHPSSFYRTMSHLRNKYPDWSVDIPARLPALARAEQSEHDRADRIVVPGSFARETLIENGIASDKVVVIPFGVDLRMFQVTPRPDPSRPLRFIFVGSVGVRKGVPVLLKAWEQLAAKHVELWIAGPVPSRVAHLIPRLPGLRLFGKVPRLQLPALLNQCDVFVFPSTFEGLAQVQLEAMACGLPVIGTRASGAQDVVSEGQEGYIVAECDPDALSSAMQRCISERHQLSEMSVAARKRSEQFSWNAYGRRWIDLLRQVV